MGLLDKKERVLDIVLTDRGRQLLSQNKLEFVFYAFSDQGVDYSGSLDLTTRQSSSFDNVVLRNFSYEADQKKNGTTSLSNKDLSTFLFTMPTSSKVVPTFVTNRDDETGDIAILRKFFIDNLFLKGRKVNRIKKPKAMIARVRKPQKTLKQRLRAYVKKQRIKQQRKKRRRGENITASLVDDFFVAISKNKALNIQDGSTKRIDKIESGSVNIASSIKKEVEVVTGLDLKPFTFSLKTADLPVNAPNGFLVEIFESGSDGSLVKLSPETVVNPVNDEPIKTGLDKYMTIYLDADVNELQEEEKLRRRTLRNSLRAKAIARQKRSRRRNRKQKRRKPRK